MALPKVEINRKAGYPVGLKLDGMDIPGVQEVTTHYGYNEQTVKVTIFLIATEVKETDDAFHN